MKPILFNTEMVQTILDGRKTVTRRLIKPQPGADADLVYAYAASRKQDIGKWNDRKTGQTWNPPYHADDILYVRETWGVYCRNWWEADYFNYKADWQAQESPYGLTEPPKWRPSIHMPKEAARLFLRVTAVRLERLQEITDEDAIREGIVRMFDHLSDAEYAEWGNKTAKGMTKADWPWNNYLWHGDFGSCGTGNRKSDAWPYQSSGYDAPRDSFSSLWNLTVDLKDWDTYGWEANPWVWVIEFERCDKPKEK